MAFQTAALLLENTTVIQRPGFQHPVILRKATLHQMLVFRQAFFFELVEMASGLASVVHRCQDSTRKFRSA